MALAVVNAIPDFHQDRLVGKRNLVVRLGRRRAVFLYLALPAAGLARRAGRRRRRHLPVAVPRRPAGAAAAGRERPHRALDLRDAARLRSGGAQHRRLLPGRGAAASPPGILRRRPAGRCAHETASTCSARRCSSPGRSRAIATCAACTAAPNRRRASACPTSSTPTRPCASPTRSSAWACPT